MRRLLAFLLLLLLCSSAASADTFTFPEDLTVIDAEAFRAVDELEALVIPSTVTAIGDYAFADCTNLRTAIIPASVTSMGKGVLHGSDEPLLLTTTAGSAAMDYALAEGIDFRAGSTFRALLIGQCNYGAADKLYGTLTDVETMRTILTRFDGTPFSCTVKTDLTGAEIKSSIASVFGGAKEQDVSLLYYSGHGESLSGALCGIDDSIINAATLRACLDEIPGRKIVIVDACHSGALIGKSSSSASPESAFVSAFMMAFTQTSRTANLAANPYYVITAAHSSEISSEFFDGTRYFGVFTTALAKGCGYDFWNETDCNTHADTNNDGVITLQEAYAYARTTASTMFSDFGYELDQTAQVWPANCTAFGLLRE